MRDYTIIINLTKNDATENFTLLERGESTPGLYLVIIRNPFSPWALIVGRKKKSPDRCFQFLGNYFLISEYYVALPPCVRNGDYRIFPCKTLNARKYE